MKGIIIPAVFVFVLLGSVPAWGHGTEGSSQDADGIRIEAAYDDGEPMSYAAVEITAPDGGVVFQKGRTDRNGVFMFAPDGPGRWRIAVSDGMGHRLELNHETALVEVTMGPPSSKASEKTAPVPHSIGIVAGISVIFGIFGLLYGWRARRCLAERTEDRAQRPEA